MKTIKNVIVNSSLQSYNKFIWTSKNTKGENICCNANYIPYVFATVLVYVQKGGACVMIILASLSLAANSSLSLSKPLMLILAVLFLMQAIRNVFVDISTSAFIEPREKI